MKSATFAGLGVVLSTSMAAAHDFWIHPASFTPDAGRPIAVRVFVGEKFPGGNQVAFQRKSTGRFQLVSKAEVIDLAKTATENSKPCGQIRPARPGSYWIAFDRTVRHIVLAPEKFAKYLKHENLQSILQARKAAGEEGKPGRERYSRYLKCLIHVGGKRDDAWKRVLKQRLEIVPLADPSAVKPGGNLKVRVLFEGKPLPKAPIFALHNTGKRTDTQSTTTNAHGIAEFEIAHKGLWLIRLVHMRRCRKCPKADWESFWGAMTFAVQNEGQAQ